MSSVREIYQPSGRVAWARTLIWFVLTLPLALLSGYLLCEALRAGIYVIILAPAICMLPAVGGVALALWLGHCRNAWVGAFSGLVASVLAFASSYQIQHAREAGFGLLNALDQLPDYVVKRFR